MDNRLPQRLKDLRMKKGLSQAMLGEVLGLSTTFIGELEVGRKMCSVETLWLLADYFEVSIDYLLGRDKFVRE